MHVVSAVAWPIMHCSFNTWDIRPSRRVVNAPSCIVHYFSKCKLFAILNCVTFCFNTQRALKIFHKFQLLFLLGWQVYELGFCYNFRDIMMPRLLKLVWGGGVANSWALHAGRMQSLRAKREYVRRHVPPGWRQRITLRLWLQSSKLHGVITQTNVIFNFHSCEYLESCRISLYPIDVILRLIWTEALNLVTNCVQNYLKNSFRHKKE